MLIRPRLPNCYKEIKLLSGNELLGMNIKPSRNQRPLNQDTVRQLIEKQKQYIALYGSPIVLGTIIITITNGNMELLDGQHRYEMLKNLYYDSINLADTQIATLLVYNPSPEQINALYVMANKTYDINGNIDKESGTVFITAVQATDLINELSKYFNNFNTQVRSGSLSAPHFDIAHLLLKINTSGILNRKAINEIIKIILQENERKLNSGRLSQEQINKCTDKFYLVYGKPKCAWFDDIVSLLNY